MNTLFFISLFISASHATTCTHPAPEIKTWKTTSNDANLRDAAFEVLRLHNQQRRKANNDIKFACISKNLTRISEEHSIFQIKAGFSEHTVPCSNFDDRCESIPNQSGCAENLAGDRNALEPINWMTNWMNSPDHRPAIKNGKTDTLGIGIVQDPDTKKYWTTVLYIRGGPNDCINE
jgi:uncharacterized protein YkwD